MGEIGQAGIATGLKDVPVILVTGDKATCEEASEFLPGVETVSVKEGLSRTCAKIIPPVEARGCIKEGVRKAIGRLGDFQPFKIAFPAEVKIEFQNTDSADAYEKCGWKRIDGRSVVSIVQSENCNFSSFLR
jgi:D-amino peptidase